MRQFNCPNLEVILPPKRSFLEMLESKTKNKHASSQNLPFTVRLCVDV